MKHITTEGTEHTTGEQTHLRMFRPPSHTPRPSKRPAMIGCEPADYTSHFDWWEYIQQGRPPRRD